mmetsp:Transcript_29239/g.76592  ORF Transcript_29239/g.76592 Transcript_29239/m.76592 type:complete len:221 (-) Transcript_29239:358-1020(-)
MTSLPLTAVQWCQPRRMMGWPLRLRSASVWPSAAEPRWKALIGTPPFDNSSRLRLSRTAGQLVPADIDAAATETPHSPISLSGSLRVGGPSTGCAAEACRSWNSSPSYHEYIPLPLPFFSFCNFKTEHHLRFHSGSGTTRQLVVDPPTHSPLTSLLLGRGFAVDLAEHNKVEHGRCVEHGKEGHCSLKHFSLGDSPPQRSAEGNAGDVAGVGSSHVRYNR